MSKKRKIPKKKPFNGGTRNYDDPAYKKWRRAIFKRDMGKCQWPNCNKTRYLQCHHIKRWADYTSLRYHPDNGILLCRSHHKSIKDKESEHESMFFAIVARNKLFLQHKGKDMHSVIKTIYNTKAEIRYAKRPISKKRKYKR